MPFVDLNMPCFYCEILHGHADSYIYCVYSHLIGRLTYDPWSEASFEDIFICCLPCSVSMISSLLWLFFAPGLCSMHGLWERRFGSSYELLQRKEDKENNEKEVFSKEIWCIIHKYAWRIISREIWTAETEMVGMFVKTRRNNSSVTWWQTLGFRWLPDLMSCRLDSNIWL